jgi:4-amino-4-deoxy-L-arabinose transferase-like glycosyltransferase
MSAFDTNDGILASIPLKGRYWGGARLIMLIYLTLGLGCGLIVHPFENLDEIEHFEAVRYVADTGRLPMHGLPQTDTYHYRQEASQPPLYYLLSAGLVRLLKLQTDDAVTFLHFNPRVACGPDAASLYDNRAVLYHNPNHEAFPWQGTLLTVHVLRAWSTVLQAVTVLSTWVLACLALPKRRQVGLLAMALVAFNPQFLLVASGVNNDNLIIPLTAVGLCFLLRTWQDGLSLQRAIGLGVLSGLAGLSKLSGWVLLGFAGLVMLAVMIRSKRIERRFVLNALLIPCVALLLAGWWFWRNWQLYGDPTALKPMLALVGARTSPIYPLLETGLVFKSFWGQIPCAFYPPAFYTFYGVLTVLAIGGLALGWRRLTAAERRAATILAGWSALVLVSWTRWDSMTPAPGGRLLFPALPAIALLMALGIGNLAQGRLGWGSRLALGLLALTAWLSMVRILPGFYAPPPRYSDENKVQPDHPLEATIGETIRLLGHDTVWDDSNSTLDVTLYWQTLAQMDEDYILALQLVSPVPGDTTLRWNYNSWPGHGNYPTSAWRPGEVILDRYRFRLAEDDLPTQAWDVHLALYQEETGERLPIWVQTLNAGNQLVLAQLRVPGIQPSCPEEERVTSDVRFGEAVALTHAWITPEQEGHRVVLCWKALQHLQTDYTVFVHLQDASGALLSTGDGPPMEGAFPTSLWHPGDVVLDVHRLMSGSVEGSAKQGEQEAHGLHVAVGLYNPTDGSRLPAYAGETPIPDAAVEIWPSRP